MCRNDRRTLLAMAAALSLPALAACASNPAPNDWLPVADDVVTEPYGAWIEIAAGTDDRSRELSGELIAVHEDSVFLMAGGRFEAVPVTEIHEARVAWYDSRTGPLMLWTAMGSVATLSHGMYGAISLPLWILGGTIATSTQSRAPLQDYDAEEGGRVETLRPYARFPQGLPPGVDRARLRAKPWLPE